MSYGYNTDGIYTIPPSNSPITNCLESIECAIAFDVKDWSEDRRSAWIYGIVFGWSYAENEIRNKFHWDDEDIAKLKQYHAEWKRIKSIIEAESEVKGMKCRTCGRRFKLLAKNRYEVVSKPIAIDEHVMYYNCYNAFDCPYCGCQNIVGIVEKDKVESEDKE